MIKAVFFDIDNTLYSYDKAHSVAMEELMKFGGAEFFLSTEQMNCLLSEANKIILERLGTGAAAIHNRLIRFQCFLELLKYPDLTKALQMEQIYWKTFLDAVVLEPGIEKLLRALQGMGVLLGIGSDQNAHIQYQKLKTLGILNYFTKIVTSEETGAEKPAAEFFGLCVEKAGCLPKECVFVGDNLIKDVEGAVQNGLYGVRYQPRPQREDGYPSICSYLDCIKKDGVHLGEIIIKKSCKGEE